MNIVPTIFIPATVGLIVLGIAFFKYPRWAIAGLIIAKPIIDITWGYYFILNINFLKIYAGLFVIFSIIYIIKNRFKIFGCPLTPLWIIFLLLNFVSIFIISDRDFLSKVEYFLRIFTGFSILILFFNIFDFEKDKDFVFSTFILSGIIVILIWLFEFFSIIPRTSVAGISEELTRVKGPYHDFFNFPFYALQTIICALPLLTNSTNLINKPVLKKITPFLLYPLIALSIIIVYKSYTKAGWTVLPLIFLLWFILRKKILPALLVVGGVILFFSINPFKTEAGSLFRKEIDILILKSDKWSPDTLFMGRYRRWVGGMDEFNGVPVINKFFGGGKLSANPENDYLRILWHNGIFGFIVFLLLLIQSSYLIIHNYIKNKDPVFLSGLFVIIMYVMFAMGFYPMFYPSFQWLLWGIVGFVLSAQKSNSIKPLR